MKRAFFGERKRNQKKHIKKLQIQKQRQQKTRRINFLGRGSFAVAVWDDSLVGSEDLRPT